MSHEIATDNDGQPTFLVDYEYDPQTPEEAFPKFHVFEKKSSSSWKAFLKLGFEVDPKKEYLLKSESAKCKEATSSSQPATGVLYLSNQRLCWRGGSVTKNFEIKCIQTIHKNDTEDNIFYIKMKERKSLAEIAAKNGWELGRQYAFMVKKDGVYFYEWTWRLVTVASHPRQKIQRMQSIFNQQLATMSSADIDESMALWSNPEKEGYMKISNGKTNWKTFWCRLKCNMLYYFLNPSKRKPKGMVYVKEYIIQRPSSASSRRIMSVLLPGSSSALLPGTPPLALTASYPLVASSSAPSSFQQDREEFVLEFTNIKDGSVLFVKAPSEADLNEWLGLLKKVSTAPASPQPVVDDEKADEARSQLLEDMQYEELTKRLRVLRTKIVSSQTLRKASENGSGENWGLSSM